LINCVHPKPADPPKHADRSLPSLDDLEDVAWVLRSDARTKKIGFVRARDLKPADRQVLDEEAWT